MPANLEQQGDDQIRTGGRCLSTDSVYERRTGSGLASLYCVGMLLTISAAQGAWGLACFILAYALWVVRRTRQAVRREA